MKKILSLAVITLVVIIGLSANVFAAEATSETELLNALAGTDATITLTGDVELTQPVEVTRNVTIDVNDHKITPASTFDADAYDYMFGVHRGAQLTVKDSGTNGKISNNGLNLTVIKITVFGETANGALAEFILNGGTLESTYVPSADEAYPTVSGNGNRHDTKVTINGGKVIAKKHLAIYQPQNGTLIVNDGTISGTTGIEVRAGKLKVNGGTIIGTAVPTVVQANGSGSTTEGAAIAIAQHKTNLNIEATINGGTLQGFTALYESNPENNTINVENIKIEVNGGDFETINNGTLAVYSENVPNFINGGTFDSDVTKYINEANVEIVVDKDGTSYVGVMHNVKVTVEGKGTVVAKPTEAIKGQTITLTVKAEEGYELKSLTVNGTAVKNDEFVMPDKDAEVKAEFTEIVKEDTTKTEDKDASPKMGIETTTLTVFSLVAIISLAGIMLIKKVNKK